MKLFRLCSFIICFLTSSIYVAAQENITPGVSQTQWDAIQSQVTCVLGGGYEVTDVVNVDSALGNRAVADGAITNPYNTLSGCLIFATRKQDGGSLSLRGTVGMFRNGGILWQSDTVINSTFTSGPMITSVRDLNNNGNVEIVCSYFSGTATNIECLWIFEWDGQSGKLICAVDESDESVLVSLGSGIEYADVDGNGVLELIGNWYANAADEQPQKVIYSWNGSLYGKWTPPSSTVSKWLLSPGQGAGHH